MTALTRPKAPASRWAGRAGREAQDRWELTRRRIRPARLALQLALTALVASTLMSTLRWGLRARDATQAWGSHTFVVVADHDLAPGDVVDAADLRRELWPDALRRESAPTDLDDVVGRVVQQPILGGEAVVEGRLGDGRLGLDPHEAAFTIVPGLAFPPVRIGDRVALFTLTDTGAEYATGAAEVNGRVVAVQLDDLTASLTVAVRHDAVASLVEAQAMGIIEVVIVP